MKRRLYMQLGRVGDILNILPLLKHDFDATGEKPVILSCAPFADVLDGVTYAEKIVLHGHDFEDTVGAYRGAEQLAEQMNLEIICTQIYGRQLYGLERCSSFLRESWARLPGSPAWGSLPLVFDRRDLTREAGVKNQLLKRGRGKPYIVLALNGTSSPFPYYSQLANYLRNKLGKDFDFVDVSGFIAPRFYDLLSTLEGAHALVAIDSAVLHLAAAVPQLPVAALITRDPSPWHGSAWRPQHFVRYYYDEAPECFAELAASLPRAACGGQMVGPLIRHAWSHFQAGGIDPETERRIQNARATWAAESKLSDGSTWVDCEYGAEDCHRSSGDGPINDPRPMPYMKDVIDHAMKDAAHDDVIAFTNADVCFTPGLTGWVLDRMAREGCAYTHRYDFKHLSTPLLNESDVMRGAWYPGSDAFFFTVSWWRRHRDEYPDMILGREQCDEVLRQLIKRHGGREINAAIYHEKHASFWDHNGQKEHNPGNQFNRALARKWFMRTGYGPNDPWWWAIPGGSHKLRVKTA